MDDSLETILFSTSTVDGSITSVQINRPDGSLVSDTDPGVTISVLGDNEMVMIIDPIAGNWEIQVTGTGTVTVIVQENSHINNNFLRCVDAVLGRYEYMFVDVPGGNPIVDGQAATALTIVEGPVDGSVVFEFEVVDKASDMITITIVEDLTNTMAASDETVESIELPDEPFSVIVQGVTTGFTFQRLALPVYVPQVIKVAFDQSSRPTSVPEDVETEIRFVVENYGDESVVVDIDILDTLGYLDSFSPTQIEISGN